MKEEGSANINNKVLLISYHFPPDSAVGAVRPAEFARFFASYGWSPIILSVKEKYYKKIDENRYQDLREILIFRTFKIPNINDFYLGSKKFFSKKKTHNISRKTKEWFLPEASQGKEREALKSLHCGDRLTL